jgi:hypothetical protein
MVQVLNDFVMTIDDEDDKPIVPDSDSDVSFSALLGMIHTYSFGSD